jgi:hypothetical protein
LNLSGRTPAGLRCQGFTKVTAREESLVKFAKLSFLLMTNDEYRTDEQPAVESPCAGDLYLQPVAAAGIPASIVNLPNWSMRMDIAFSFCSSTKNHAFAHDSASYST